MEIFLARDPAEPLVHLARGDEPARTVPVSELPTAARALLEPSGPAGPNASDPVWVWTDTARAYRPDLAPLVRRAHDLRAVERLLRSVRVDGARSPAPTARLSPTPPWLDVEVRVPHTPDPAPLGLFTVGAPEAGIDDLRERYAEHRAVLADLAEHDPGLRLLAAAESAGALVAAELYAAGLPWDRDRHEEILAATLGPRPAPGRRPAVMAALSEEIRAGLRAPDLNPDSPAALLRALQAAGIGVAGTSRWELRPLVGDHPVLTAVLAYKKHARLLTANGWSWLEDWVAPPAAGMVRGRFHPDYVPSAVVTGRWATHGGGAMQIPKALRAAVAAEPGWSLVVADAAQIEPRVLAAMAHDTGLADAGRDRDLYDGLVAAGLTDSRAHAKVGMLGALYGSTTGTSAELMPVLRRAYPRAIALVDEAARTGERGGVVRTHLGRCSPAGRPADPQAARAWGRFTRNFVVQGSAAEWAVAWMARLRLALRDLDGRAELVYFLHDEIIVHCPTPLAGAVRAAIEAAAAEAGRIMFGDFPITFPLTVRAAGRYDEAI